MKTAEKTSPALASRRGAEEGGRRVLVFLYLFPKMSFSFLGIIHGDTGTNRHVDTWSGNWTPQLIRGLPSDALIMEGSGLPWYPLPGTRSQGPAPRDPLLLQQLCLFLSVKLPAIKHFFLKLTSVL